MQLSRRTRSLILTLVFAFAILALVMPMYKPAFAVTVTVPITCTTDNGGTQATLTLTASDASTPSPNTVLCDGVSHNISTNNGITLTATEPADGGNTRSRFSGVVTTTVSPTTCASGTCAAWTFTNYYQLQNTYQSTTNGVGPQNWDTGLTDAVTGYAAGASASTLCTISPSAGTTTAASCAAWGDYNRAVTETSTMAGAPVNTRWYVNPATGQGNAWTDTTGGNTHTGAFYKQLFNTYQGTTNGVGPQNWDTGLTDAVTGTYTGTASSTICTLSPSAGTTTTVSCTGYEDYNTQVTMTASMSGAPANTRWYVNPATGQGNAWTDTTGGNTHTGAFYKQLSNTYQASTNGVGPSTWDTGLTDAVTGTYTGTASSTICTLSPSAGTTTTVFCTAYADYNTAVTETSTMAGAGANIRWYVNPLTGQGNAWTDTTGGGTHTGAFYKQLTNTYQATPTGQRATFDAVVNFVASGTYTGTASSTICTIATSNGGGAASCSGYADYNAAVAIPSTGTVSSTEQWITPNTVSWTQTTGGNTNNANYYNQFKPTLTLSGLDTSRSRTLSYTNQGTAGTTATLNGGANTVWIDYSTSASVQSPNTITISSTERFDSYNTTASFTWTPTTAGSKTWVYQHEYLIWPRVNEMHYGTVFSPMPSVTFTGTLTSRNGTATAVTFNTQQADDYLQPSSQYWIQNGTLTLPTDLTWRGIIVNGTGTTTSLSNANNVTISSTSIHVGNNLGQGHHIRAGVDSATSRLTYNSYSVTNAMLNFTATATAGTHNVKVEYLQSDYSGITAISVNKATLPVGNYTITTDNTLSPPVYVLTINNLHFSTDTIVINFQSAAAGGGGGGGGGGGSSSSSTSIIPSNPPVGSSLGLNVTVPAYYVSPGKSATQQITIQWGGATKIIITDIQFSKNPQWFQLGQSLPVVATMSAMDQQTSTTIPLSVSVPADVQGTSDTVDMTITAITGTSQTSKTVPVTVTYAATSDLALYAFVGIIVLGVGAYAVKHRK